MNRETEYGSGWTARKSRVISRGSRSWNGTARESDGTRSVVPLLSLLHCSHLYQPLQGTDSRSLLRGSLAYFEQLCSTEGADQVRLNSIEEAKPRLARMLAALEKEVAELDAALADERQALEEERKMTMTGFLDGLRDPELQNVSGMAEAAEVVAG